MWVDDSQVIDREIYNDPADLYAFARETWVQSQTGKWKIELTALEPGRKNISISWTRESGPSVGKIGHIPDVIHRYVELRERVNEIDHDD